jgi:hypothetical protein
MVILFFRCTESFITKNRRKKMKKRDLKKLALMGITGGIIAVSHPASAHELNSASGTMLAGGCGGGCNHTAYNERGSNQGYYSSYPQEDNYYPQGQSGCHGNRGNSQYHSCSSSPGNYQSHSCGGASNSWGGYTADNDVRSSVSDEPVETPNSMTESEFKAKLSPAARADFDKLSTNGKDKAMKMASHSCKGKNDCKGQNACKTDKNDCAGKGGCKGQSKCAANPDQAVKAASMQDKRASLNNRPSYSPR